MSVGLYRRIVFGEEEEKVVAPFSCLCVEKSGGIWRTVFRFPRNDTIGSWRIIFWRCEKNEPFLFSALKFFFDRMRRYALYVATS
jgi:hypothetical protein